MWHVVRLRKEFRKVGKKTGKVVEREKENESAKEKGGERDRERQRKKMKVMKKSEWLGHTLEIEEEKTGRWIITGFKTKIIAYMPRKNDRPPKHKV